MMYNIDHYYSMNKEDLHTVYFIIWITRLSPLLNFVQEKVKDVNEITRRLQRILDNTKKKDTSSVYINYTNHHCYMVMQCFTH
jgi:hypothetical protein